MFRFTLHISRSLHLLCLFIVTLYFVGCKKETVVDNEDIKSDAFLRVYPEQGYHLCQVMKATEDNGCLLFINEDLNAAGDASKLTILKINEKGEIEWRKIVADLQLRDLVNYTPLADGSSLLSSNRPGKLVKLDKEGNLVFATSYNYDILNNTSYYGGKAIPGIDNTYKIGYSNGVSTATTVGFVASISQDGGYLGSIQFDESNFIPPDSNFKMLTMNLYKYGNGQTYFFTGLAFNSSPWQWDDPPRIYASKQILYEDSTLAFSKTVFLDTSLSEKFGYGRLECFSFENNSLLIMTTAQNSSFEKGQIIKVNNELDVLWRCDVIASPSVTRLTSLEQAKDGNYLLTGVYFSSGTLFGYPFVAKISSNGTLLWTKKFSPRVTGLLQHVIETPKGDYFLAGQTRVYGFGNSDDDLFILKTDKSLNY